MELRATLLGNHARNVRIVRNVCNVRNARARDARASNARARNARDTRAYKEPRPRPTGIGTRPGPGQR